MWDEIYIPRRPHVVIVGGGLAGLAAASSLVGQDLEITILESRTRLGGRAGSFPDAVSGTLLDNCQHVSMNCCVNLTNFCRRIGVDHQFALVDRIRFLGLDGRISLLKGAWLPAPLHFLPSLARLKFLGWSDKVRLSRAILALLRWSEADVDDVNVDDVNVEESRNLGLWLKSQGQTERLRTWFWEPLLLSALNERLDCLDVGYARKVIVDGLLRNRRGYALRVPRVPLGGLFDGPAQKWCENNGVKVRINSAVRSIDADDERAVQGVTLRDWTEIPADFVILAVPFSRVREMVGESMATHLEPVLRGIDRLRSSPIVGIHFRLDREICPYDHVVTPGRLVQWVFNATHHAGDDVDGERLEGEAQHLQCVISAAGELEGWENARIRDEVWRELTTMWPSAHEAVILQSRVVREHHATFSARPGVDRLRPLQRTAVDGFFLAGDWTATGWPATMESAVRSGYLAAEGVLQDLGFGMGLARRLSPLAAELPMGWITRRLGASATKTGK